MDSIHDYGPESLSEEEQEDINEIHVKPKGKQPKRIEKPKNV